MADLLGSDFSLAESHKLYRIHELLPKQLATLKSPLDERIRSKTFLALRKYPPVPYRALELFRDLEPFYAVSLEIRRCLPFWSRKQAVQNWESGCLQTLAT